MRTAQPPAHTTPGAAASALWNFVGRGLSLDRPRIMGILNITPDSFSDGGELPTPRHAVERAARMVAEGADLLDVGGESTRPGASPVDASLQVERVVPVIEAIRARVDVPISVDTRDAVVAQAALRAGAAIVNDVSALNDPRMAAAVREAGAGLVLMHMRGTPGTMQTRAVYDDAAGEVTAELATALERALAAGIPRERVVLDPGLGFAKTAEQSLELLASLPRLAALGLPLLVGPSRKSFLGRVSGVEAPSRRLAGTLAACVAALLGGARLFRVHDVAPAREALDVAEAIRRAGFAER